MSSLPLAWSALSVPLALAACAAAPRPWRVAPLGAAWGVVVGLGLAATALTGGAPAVASAWPDLPAAAVRIDAPTALVSAMVHVVGFAVLRFSRTALRDDPRGERAARAVCATLVGVSGFVLADHLVVSVLAWTAVGLAVHPLLTHADRPGARRAAREKFVVGRLAELALLAGLAAAAGLGAPLRASALAALPPDHPAVPVVALAAVAAVVLRTAVVPFHGWLVRVTEAPTPVSALLHAGVVNLGGLLLLRLAPAIDATPAARWLLVGVGVTTAVVGGLVAAVRPSVKSALAWSTVGQMGFLLLECGLSAWPLALLHLLAHSCYKAHAFLTAGSAVDHAAARRYAAAPPSPGPARGALAVAAAAGFAALALAVGAGAVALPGALILLATLPRGARTAPAGLAVAGGWAVAGGVADQLLVGHAAPDPAAVAVAVAAFVVGAAAALAREAAPDGAFARRAQPALLAGLWLDRPVSAAVATLSARARS